MKTLGVFFTLLFIGVSLNSCIFDPEKEPEYPEVIKSRNYGDVLILFDGDESDTLVQSVIALTEQQFGNFIGVEHMFDYTFSKPGNESASQKSTANVIYIKTSLTENKILYQEGSDPMDKLSIELTVMEGDAGAAFIHSKSAEITNKINRREVDRLIAFAKQSPSIEAEKQIEEKMKLKISIPATFSSIQEISEDFSWLRKREVRRANKKSSLELHTDLLLYTFKFDSSTFSPAGLVWKGNQYMKRNVEFYNGKSKTDKFMQMSENTDNAIISYTNINGHSAIEMLGSYAATDEYESEYGNGGYYYMVAIHDEKNDRVIVTNGLTFVPGYFIYREYMREIKAVGYSLNP
jgi:hypothetical protein